ncbi:hypothetical protein [Martelella alba]|uniref:PH domain-containing protein n=1 Tax=Martelella alba TaxID=2590451 RepID=A0ABY2SR84_9HYPH|nr:hypothetical protein [Martelella alba]TKI08083.1 hypothetical protein FCN80_02725 [Martelella alba]
MDNHDDIDRPYRPARRQFFLSWAAYVRPLVLFAVLSALGLLVSQSAKTADIILGGYGILFIGIVKVIYDIAARRRFRFFFDPEGVWLDGGPLSWRRRKKGMTWLEIDEAAGLTEPFGWLTHSHGIDISSRFSPSRRLRLSHIKHGDEAVAAINDILAEDFAD